MPPEHGESNSRQGSLWLRVPTGLFLLLACALAIGRTINFDEWLVLRSGWLLSTGQNSNIPFLMPMTALVGHLASGDALPSTLVPALRIAALTLVLSSLFFGIHRQTRDPFTVCLALLLTMTSGAFYTHAIEFRYDLVILFCWLSAWGLLAQPGPRTALWLGMLSAILAMHHTKGLFYAAWLGVATLAFLPRSPTTWKGFLLGLAVTTMVWVTALLARGQTHQAWQVYEQFATLGVTHQRVSAWQSLHPRLAADGAWWALILALLIIRRVRHTHWRPSPTTTLALAPLAFILLHPHPWDYLVAPLVPFLALVAAQEASHWMNFKGHHLALKWRLTALVCVALLGSNTLMHSRAARNAADLQVLDATQRLMQAGDRVLDPSGALYMGPPTETAWYRDTLWPENGATPDWSRVTWVVASYRLTWVDPQWERILPKHHRQVCGWLWMHEDDARLEAMRAACTMSPSNRLSNHWERAN